LTVDDLQPKLTPFSAEGRRAFEATESWHDDVLRWMPLGLPRTFGSPYAMEVVDAGSHYLIVYEQNNTPRWIWPAGRTLPQDLPANSMGFFGGPLGGGRTHHRYHESDSRRVGWIIAADVG